jgi:hypothetical protein
VRVDAPNHVLGSVPQLAGDGIKADRGSAIEGLRRGSAARDAAGCYTFSRETHVEVDEKFADAVLGGSAARARAMSRRSRGRNRANLLW